MQEQSHVLQLDRAVVQRNALELAPFNVLVNAIAPGPFATGINGGRLRTPEAAERMKNYIPLGRISDPAEIQGLALLLASGATSYMTGAVIPVDGGGGTRDQDLRGSRE